MRYGICGHIDYSLESRSKLHIEYNKQRMASLRIISYNVNGIRAAMKKGLIDWLKTDPGDVICLQETKAVKDQVNHKLFADLGYYDYWQSALKKGYSGVAVFTRIKPDNVIFGNEYTCNIEEGRI